MLNKLLVLVLLLGAVPANAAYDVYLNQPQNLIFASPNGTTGNGKFRSSVNADLPDTAVTPGTYNFSTIVVNQKGVITSASSGTTPNTTYTTQTTTYSAVNKNVIGADSSGGAFVVTIPLAASNANGFIAIKKIDSSGNAVTMTASGADTIDGLASQSMSVQYDSVSLYSDGVSKWYVY